MQLENKKLRTVPFILIPLIVIVIIPMIFGSGDVSEETSEITPPASELSTESGLPDISSISLNEIVDDFGSLGPISSLVIARDDELVVENYYRGMNANRGHNIKSASKSILSILTGIAIDKGYLEGVDQTIEEFFPEYFSRNPDSVKASITVSDLLTMRSGLRSTSGRNYGAWVTSRDWIDYALGSPLVGQPGDDRIYSTGNTHLLGVVLAKAANMSLREFANRYLFGPMDIQIGGWDRDPRGYYLGGNNMALRPTDMVKIGRLMMDVGVYNGEQLVSREWVIESVKPVTGRRRVNNYGYLWFRRTTGDYDMVYAFGNGGQYIMMVPELDAVITVTTQIGAPNTRRYRGDLFDEIDDRVIPWLSVAAD